MRNLLATMVLGGLWHGAGWTFVLWGALHGVGLVVERLVWPEPNATVAGRLGRVVRGLVTFHIVCVGWVFFRSVDLERAIEVFGALGGSWTSAPRLSLGVGLLLLVGMATQLTTTGRADHWWDRVSELPVVVQAIGITAAILTFDVLGPAGVAPFLYFAF